MSIQLLISTMHQTDHSLLDRMNVRCDAVVVNQCDRCETEIFEYNGHTIKWISMPERGVGLSRNTALYNATADIVLFADDDMRYNDDYVENVIGAFEKNKKAEVICFNVELVNSMKKFGHRLNKSEKRLRFYNSMRYGACLIGARRKVLLKNRISFSLLFGGGAEFSCGEDSLFIKDCLEKKIKMYSHPYILGSVEDSQSSWYQGVNDKLFTDKGILLTSAFPVIHKLLFVYYAYKMRRMDAKYGFKRIIKLFYYGSKLIKKYR